MKPRQKASAEKPTPNKQIDWNLGVKLIAALVGAATLAFGIYQYQTKPKRENEQELNSRKKDLYFKAMDSAAAFARATTQAEADEARKQFWQLYYGQLSAVENQEVKTAMQTFGGGVKSWEEFNDPTDFTPPSEFEYYPDGRDKPGVKLGELSYRLTQACKADLGIK